MIKAFSTNGGKRNVCRLVVVKPEGTWPVGRPRRRSVDNIIMVRKRHRLAWCRLR
jgi:hypothetical protein